MRHRLDLRTLAGEAGTSIATAYRYLHEALDVIAARTSDLDDVLASARADGLAFVCLDGTLVPTDRVAARAERPSPVVLGQASRLRRQRPGPHRPDGLSTVDLRSASRLDPRPDRRPRAGAARALSARRPRTAGAGDKGYTGAGIGVHVPVRHQPDGPLHTNNRCYNALITALRAPTERDNALLGRWRALDRVTVCPQRIGAIAAAALVLTRGFHAPDHVGGRGMRKVLLACEDLVCLGPISARAGAPFW
jgi:hypothetical protein